MPAYRSLRSSTAGRRASIAIAIASVALLAACTSPSPPTPGSGTESFVEDLDAPWSIAFHGDVALVSERDSARVLEVSEDGEVHEVAVIDGVEPGGEGGLLGLAVNDGELFTYFTAEGENRVERRAIVGDAGGLALGPATAVIDGIPAAGTHNGGRIAFGPDGMLYVTTGDAGDRDSAQDLDALSGKILRLTPDGEVPSDNPFDDSPVTATGTAIRRASPGVPRVRCTRASSGRTPGTNSTPSSPAATTAGPRSRGSPMTMTTSTPCSSGDPMPRARAASP